VGGGCVAEAKAFPAINGVSAPPLADLRAAISHANANPTKTAATFKANDAYSTQVYNQAVANGAFYLNIRASEAWGNVANKPRLARPIPQPIPRTPGSTPQPQASCSRFPPCSVAAPRSAGSCARDGAAFYFRYRLVLVAGASSWTDVPQEMNLDPTQATPWSCWHI